MISLLVRNCGKERELICAKYDEYDKKRIEINDLNYIRNIMINNMAN